jgi:hypothetical protein
MNFKIIFKQDHPSEELDIFLGLGHKEHAQARVTRSTPQRHRVNVAAKLAPLLKVRAGMLRAVMLLPGVVIHVYVSSRTTLTFKIQTGVDAASATIIITLH